MQRMNDLSYTGIGYPGALCWRGSSDQNGPQAGNDAHILQPQ